MDDVIPFQVKLRQLLKEKGISTWKFEIDTGICRKIFYSKNRKFHKSMLMAIAYYLEMNVEEMIDGTDAMDYWYC